MTTDSQGPRRGRGLPGMPLLGRWGLVLGVAILFAVVILGGNLVGGDESRVNAIAEPLSELPSFPVGTIPADAPNPERDLSAFTNWVLPRPFADWERAFKEAGRPWAEPEGPLLLVRISGDGPDVVAATVFASGLQSADYVITLLGIPGRIELARREKPDTQAELQRQRDEMVACLAGVWGRTLMAPARLAAVAPAPRAQSVRLGAEIGDPSVCDTFTTDGS